MKEKFKTKGIHTNTKEDQKAKPVLSNHEEFKLGEGYGSGERLSDAQERLSKKQYGDNPGPRSGGGYDRAGEAQPAESPEQP